MLKLARGLWEFCTTEGEESNLGQEHQRDIFADVKKVDVIRHQKVKGSKVVLSVGICTKMLLMVTLSKQSCSVSLVKTKLRVVFEGKNEGHLVLNVVTVQLLEAGSS